MKQRTATKQLRLLAGIGFISIFAASSAFAADFQPEAKAIWVARTDLLSKVSGDGTTRPDADTVLANMRTACDGLQSEQMSHEYGKVPQWALNSQIDTCAAYVRWSGGGGFLVTKVPCRDASRAIDLFGSLNEKTDPEDVVAVTTRLKTNLTAMLAAAKGADRRSAIRCNY